LKKILKSFLLILIICLIFLTDCLAQEAYVAKNSVFGELFGNGGLYSINYERSLSKNINARIGFSTIATRDFIDKTTSGRITTFPVLLSFLTGKRSNHIELGTGFLLGNKKDYYGTRSIIDITAFAGYRYQPGGRGFLFRAGLTPFLSLNGTNYPDKIFLSGGLSFGYHF
jgi:hypothetical protein